ncbi:MAG: RNA polymerase sigma factor FliA [Methylococcaceae bacterium]
MTKAAMYLAQSSEDADQLLISNLPLVKRIAHHLSHKLPNTVDIDDLIQAGTIGLIEAVRKYDASQGASFETYAGIRIRGAMFDEVRKVDWTPRSVHRRSRTIAAAIKDIENSTGREASDTDIASKLGVGLAEYHKDLQDIASARLCSFEEMVAEDGERSEVASLAEPEPSTRHIRDAFQQALATAIDSLPEREKLVISLYYDDELNLKEIGEVLGVSESRVSQISSQAMVRLRAKLSDWLNQS